MLGLVGIPRLLGLLESLGLWGELGCELIGTETDSTISIAVLGDDGGDCILHPLAENGGSCGGRHCEGIKWE